MNAVTLFWIYLGGMAASHIFLLALRKRNAILVAVLWPVILLVVVGGGIYEAVIRPVLLRILDQVEDKNQK